VSSARVTLAARTLIPSRRSPQSMHALCSARTTPTFSPTQVLTPTMASSTFGVFVRKPRAHGRQYWQGCVVLRSDKLEGVETIAAEHACALFGADHAYVQPHSGIDANLTAYWANQRSGSQRKTDGQQYLRRICQKATCPWSPVLARIDAIAQVEPRIAEATRAELTDQRHSLKLIASENYASLPVLATMGLNVGVVRAEQSACMLCGDRLDGINVLAASVKHRLLGDPHPPHRNPSSSRV
jgi:hypothetical protein